MTFDNITGAIKIGSKIDNAADVICGVENGADAIKDVASSTKKLAAKGTDAAVAAKGAKQAKNAKAKAALIESAPDLDVSSVKKAFDETGNISSKPYVNGRPSRRKGLAEKVWENAKNADGLVRDPNTQDIINWTPGQTRKNVWDMGHIPEAKYSKTHKKYIAGEMTPKEFVDLALQG